MWIPEASESMLSSVDELPPSSQLIVYIQSKREPPPELRTVASLDQWENLVETKARQAIEFGDFTQVQMLLAERSDRTAGSALYALGALASMNTGNYLAARNQLDQGISSAQSVNRIDRLVELWRLLGELNREESNFIAANEAFATAQKLAMRMGSAVLALQIYASRANLSANGVPLPDSSELDEILKATSDADFASVRLQLLGLFRLCGEHSVPLLLKGLRVFKLEYVPYLPTQPSWADEAFQMQSQKRVNEFFQKLLESHPEDTAVRSALAEILEQALNPNVSARTA